jgi:tol-pal system protein YbgF
MIKKLALTACALTALTLAPVSAQTFVTPVTPDPQEVALVDRVDHLEAENRKLTADNERLQFELRKAREDLSRLNAQLGTEPEPKPAEAPKPAPQPAAPVAAPAPTVDSATAYKDAYNYVMSSDHAGAENALQRFLTTYPSSEQAPEARYWLGQVLMAQGKAPEAAEQFLNVVRNSAKSPKAPDSYVYLGMAMKQMGQNDQACAVFRDVATKFPNATAAVKQKASQQARSCQP